MLLRLIVCGRFEVGWFGGVLRSQAHHRALTQQVRFSRHIILRLVGCGETCGSRRTSGQRNYSIKNLRIDYEAGAGEFTSPDITTHYYDPDDGYIRDRRYLRNADRTFRIDRTSQAIDTELGEIVTRMTRSGLRRHKL
jgi:hypothetical protein